MMLLESCVFPVFFAIAYDIINRNQIRLQGTL